MIEIIDENNNKMKANIMCRIVFEGIEYCIYLIERDNVSINMFISKIVSNSEGIRSIDSGISSDVKDKLDVICNKIINKVSIDNLNSEGVKIIYDYKLDNGVNKFITNNSYVCTLKKEDINDIYKFYQFKNNIHSNVVKIKESTNKLDKEDKKNIWAIIFGLISFVIIVLLIFLIIFK